MEDGPGDIRERKIYTDHKMKTTTKLHAGHVEIAVVKLLNYRVFTIVPNIASMFRHECDLLALDDKGRFTEIEIKVSASDLKADFKKAHGHKSKYISRLIYAMPVELCEKYAHIIPNNCGIISVHVINRTKNMGALIYAKHYRMAKHDKQKEKPPSWMVNEFMRLGCMRIWSLKEHNNKILIQ